MIEVRFGDKGLGEISVSIVGGRRSTHDEFSTVTLSDEVQRTCLQAWEYFDKVLEESELLSIRSASGDMGRREVFLTKS